MHILQQHTQSFCQETEKRLKSLGLNEMIPDQMLNDFDKLLEEMANESKYAEGERILVPDLHRLNSSVRRILSELTERFVARDSALEPTQRHKSDIFNSMMVASDYLFARASRALGSPDMPPSFGIENRKTVADLTMDSETKIRAIDYKEATAEEHFKKQRKRDAAVVIKDNEDLEKNIINCRATPLEIAQYAAEYQALKQRQENHTDIWRFFHGKENERRNALLAHMKKVLTDAMGSKDYPVDIRTPHEMAHAHLTFLTGNRIIEGFKPESIAKRQLLDNHMINPEATNRDRANAEAEIISDENLERELREAIKLDPIDLEPSDEKEEEFSLQILEEPPTRNEASPNLH